MADPADSPRLRYVPALDGIRAFAVVAVMAYHNFSWLPGGFFGVDAFFVLSGFLITSLLVSEWQGSGTVRLGRFWARRARRLLPALFVLVAAIGVVAAIWPSVFGPVDLLPGSLATLFYGANWYFIGLHSSYFAATGPPSPLLHTWSLAIEEQFYLVWPLVVLAILGAGVRRRRSRPTEAERELVRTSGPSGAVVGELSGSAALVPVAGRPGEVLSFGGSVPASRARRLEVLFVVASLGAVASALWMAVLSPAGGATTRAYYGTDSRAQALLVGAAVAAAFARWGAVRGAAARRGFAGLALVGAGCSVLAWWAISFTSSLAFHGGFLLVSLAAVAVVAGVVQAPRGPVARGLAWAPVRGLGRISYGVYLWYWPVILVMTAGRMHATGWTLFAERTVVTVGLAAASYRLVEQPIRRGVLPNWRGLVAVPVGAGLALAAVGAATLVPVAQGAPAASPASSVVSQVPGSGAGGPAGGGSASGSGAGGPVGTGDASGSSNVAAAASLSHPVKVLLVGDSIAGSLGVGLDQVAARYGIELVNQGSPGCSVSMDQLIRVLWYTLPPGSPCRTGNPSALIQKWQKWVDTFNPDVVIYLARGELFNQEVGGQWEHLGQQAFDRYVAQRFATALQVLGSRGAAVVLATTPAYDSGTQPSGAPWPETDPGRVPADNAIIRQAVAAAESARYATGSSPGAGAGTTSTTGVQPPRYSVFNLESLVTPGGRYAQSVGGVDLRCSDGVHFTAAGGEWVAPQLLPELADLGRYHQAASPGGAWPGVPPPAPSWWTKLPCG